MRDLFQCKRVPIYQFRFDCSACCGSKVEIFYSQYLIECIYSRAATFGTTRAPSVTLIKLSLRGSVSPSARFTAESRTLEAARPKHHALASFLSVDRCASNKPLQR